MTQSQSISFCKMHGLGNDFVVIDMIHQSIDLTKATIAKLADRHLGIGFDQLLVIKKSSIADFACQIFNADGSEAEQCGNGVRCVARFIHEKNLSSNTSRTLDTKARLPTSLTLETKAGILKIIITDYNHIQVIMGIPCFDPQTIPFVIEKQPSIYELEDLSTHEISVLSMGNPHTIVKVPSVQNYPVAKVGAQITSHPSFPQGTNAGFVEVIDRIHIRLRTFERGSGETFACGSNACAAVVAGVKNGWLDSIVTVELPYGQLLVEWQGGQNPVLMTGPAIRVFDGILTS